MNFRKINRYEWLLMSTAHSLGPMTGLRFVRVRDSVVSLPIPYSTKTAYDFWNLNFLLCFKIFIANFVNPFRIRRFLRFKTAQLLTDCYGRLFVTRRSLSSVLNK